MVLKDNSVQYGTVGGLLVAVSAIPWLLGSYAGWMALVTVALIAILAGILFGRITSRAEGRIRKGALLAGATGLSAGVLNGAFALGFIRDFQEDFMGQAAPATAGVLAFLLLALTGGLLGIAAGWISARVFLTSGQSATTD